MKFNINQTQVSEQSPCYIIAEMSANHCGSFDKAIEIIHSAKACGANAIKLQTYRADTITLDCDEKDFQLPSDNPWESHNTLYKLYEKAYTPWEWHKALFEEGKKIGIDVFSSPFDSSAVDLLESLDCPVYKIASPEISYIGLIARVAKTGKPVILSTGLATQQDIELAIETLEANNCHQYAFLKCTTAYPAPAEDINLATIKDIAQRYQCIAGLSDHTLGNSVAIASIALGGKIIEKHFVLERNSESVDGFFSLTPDDFTQLVDDVRNIEKAIGTVNYDISPASQKNLLAKRSLYVAKDVKKGHVLTDDDVKSVRPSYGLHPKYLPEIIGKKATQDLKLGQRFALNMIEK